MKVSLPESDQNTPTLHLSGAKLLMLRQGLVEATLGTHLQSYASHIGVPRTRGPRIIRILGDVLDKQPHDEELTPLENFELDISKVNAKAFRNALELVTLDLGHRFYLEEAAHMLDQMNGALIAPLHLEHRRRAVGRGFDSTGAQEPLAAIIRETEPAAQVR